MKQETKISVFAYVKSENMKIYEKYSDEKLLELVRESKEPEKSDAFSVLYQRYSGRIYLYCRKIFGEGTFAEDIFQDTFMQLLKTIEKGNRINNLLGYLLRTARNLSLNFRRNNNKNQFVEFEDYQAIIEDSTLYFKELSQIVDSMLEILPETHKEAFVLQNYLGLSYSEIANLTEVPVTTVRNRIVRAKTKLRTILEPILEPTFPEGN